MDYHYDVYKLMFRIFQLKNVPLENSLAALWECRRVSHALCVAPVNEAFLTSLADHYDGLGSSVDLWISCLKGSKALQVGFAHSFSVIFSNSPQGSLSHENSFQSHFTLEEVKNAAFQLISSVRSSYVATKFLLYHKNFICILTNILSSGSHFQLFFFGWISLL